MQALSQLKTLEWFQASLTPATLTPVVLKGAGSTDGRVSHLAIAIFSAFGALILSANPYNELAILGAVVLYAVALIEFIVYVGPENFAVSSSPRYSSYDYPYDSSGTTSVVVIDGGSGSRRSWGWGYLNPTRHDARVSGGSSTNRSVSISSLQPTPTGTPGSSWSFSDYSRGVSTSSLQPTPTETPESSWSFSGSSSNVSRSSSNPGPTRKPHH